MFPLLQRVELRIPYTVLTLLWAYLLDLPPVSFGVYKGIGLKDSLLNQGTVLIQVAFYAIMVVWHGFEAFVEAPRSLPDLWVVANVGIGAVGFAICYLWCVVTLMVESGLGGGSPINNALVEKKSIYTRKKKQ